MAKINKKSLKAVQNRNRVNLHRRWKSIVNNDARFINTSPKKIKSINVESKERINNEIIGSEERLRNWALKYNISKRAVSDLLKILIALGMSWLPKDSRTLLSTPRQIHMTNLTNGKLWYAFQIIDLDILFLYNV